MTTKGDNTPTNTLEEIVDIIHSNCPYTKPCPVYNQGIRAIEELVSQAVNKAEIKLLRKLCCCDHPSLGLDSINVCNAEHLDLLKELEPPNQVESME
jgi:hypothetical protein